MGENTVIMEEEDFKKATPGKSDHIEIIQFVVEKEVDSIYFEKPYYIAPTKGGEKAYALLRDSLKKEGKAAIGTFVFHKREWVCLLKPSADALVLNQLRFAEEIRSTKGLEIPQVSTKAEELKMAASLIAQLTKPFKPEQFRDEYAEQLLKIIEAKSKGKTTKFKAMKVVHTTETEDLMQKLKASLKPAKKAS
jgi:DNA end-binding protein Ku